MKHPTLALRVCCLSLVFIVITMLRYTLSLRIIGKRNIASMLPSSRHIGFGRNKPSAPILSAGWHHCLRITQLQQQLRFSCKSHNNDDCNPTSAPHTPEMYQPPEKLISYLKARFSTTLQLPFFQRVLSNHQHQQIAEWIVQAVVDYELAPNTNSPISFQLIRQSFQEVPSDTSSNSITRGAKELNSAVRDRCEYLAKAMECFAHFNGSSAAEKITLPLNWSIVRSDGRGIDHTRLREMADSYMVSIKTTQNVFHDIVGHHTYLAKAQGNMDGKQWTSEVSRLLEDSLEIDADSSASLAIHDTAQPAAEGPSASNKSLKKYAEAATKMGDREWVRHGNEWLLGETMSFFRKNGARKDYVKYIMDTKAPSDLQGDALYAYKQQLIESLELDLMASNNDNESNSFQKIRLLDVGSCYNPLQKIVNETQESHLYDITALDLFPGDPSVLQCDCIDLKITLPNTSPVIVPLVPPAAPERSDSTGTAPAVAMDQLVSLPAESADVVTMSLVLSYLPTADLRMQMIRNAREILVGPGHQGRPHHSGLLIIFEKESIFGQDTANQHNHASLVHNWKQAIRGLGFEFVKYRKLYHSGRKSHGLVFRKVSDAMRDSVGWMPDGVFKLWIKQDFATRDIDAENLLPTSPTTVPLVAGEDRGAVKDEAATTTSTTTTSTSTTTSRSETSLNLMGYVGGSSSRKAPIAIIGGGIGGTALALSLQRRGLPVKIFEKDKSFDARKQGYALTIQQASSALRALDLTETLMKEGVTSYAHESFGAHGEVLGCYGPMVRDGVLLGSHDFSQQEEQLTAFVENLIAKNHNRHNVHIPRQRLRDMMLQRVDPEVFQWNKKLIEFRQVDSNSNSNSNSEGMIELYFEDGSQELASMVVAADGIYSTIVQQVLHNTRAVDSLNYLGLMVILGISSNVEASSFTVCGRTFRKQTQWLDGASRVFTMPYDSSMTMWQLSYPLDAKAAYELTLHPERLKQQALEICAGWHQPLIDLLSSTDPSLVSGHPAYDRDPTAAMERLTNKLGRQSRITVLGDAAHPMSPFKGQGANQALLDALELAKAITSSDLARPGRTPIHLALREYEHNMAARAQNKVMRSRDAATSLHSSRALSQGNITRAQAAEGLH